MRDHECYWCGKQWRSAAVWPGLLCRSCSTPKEEHQIGLGLDCLTDIDGDKATLRFSAIADLRRYPANTKILVRSIGTNELVRVRLPKSASHLACEAVVVERAPKEEQNA